jgi:hypothetical protein
VEVLTDNNQSPPLMNYLAGDHFGGKWSIDLSKSRSPEVSRDYPSSILTGGARSTNLDRITSGVYGWESNEIIKDTRAEEYPGHQFPEGHVAEICAVREKNSGRK